MVELHWEMTGHYALFPILLEDLEGHLESVRLCGREVFHLFPEELLLQLCFHGSKDCWEELERICCVAELVRSRPAVDWERVAMLATKLRCERILLLGLSLAHDLLAAPLPDDVLKKVKADSKVRKLAAQVSGRLFEKGGELSGNGISSSFSFYHMKVRDSFTDGIRYGFKLATRPTINEWIYFPLPGSLSFLHYILRPIRLALMLGLGLMKRLVFGGGGP